MFNNIILYIANYPQLHESDIERISMGEIVINQIHEMQLSAKHSFKSAFVQTRIVINSNYNHYFFSVRQIKKSFVHETYNLANQHNSLSFHKAFIRMTVLVPFRPRLAVFLRIYL